MDPSDFIPGLVNELDNRFGKFGRLISSLVLLGGSAFIILLPIGLVATVAVQIVNIEPFDIPTSPRLLDVMVQVALWAGGTIVIYVVLIGLAILVVEYWYRPRVKGAIEDFERLSTEVTGTNEETKELIEEIIVLLAEAELETQDSKDDGT
ncbi:MAG: hypothetical protein F4X03_11010 [Dehalococcoidia bacterium]|nr:hypothetical protein [Dehalococcoidia bacterium]MYD29417.1 hypothetical protein [Dehalococcoidia bacterium]